MRFSKLSVLPLLAVCTLAAAPAWSATASSPDDLCAPDADPCVISGRYAVDDSANLDFGMRHVVVADGARLVFQGFFVDIYCGGLVVEPGATLDISGRLDDYEGVYLDLEVEGHCSNAPETACNRSYDCPTGGECAGATFSFEGRVIGRARGYSQLTAIVGGDASINGRINLSARAGGQGEAGGLVVQTTGSIDMGGRFRARGAGFDGAGGYIDLRARGDVRVTDVEVDMMGQDFDGGGFLITAGNDASFSGEVRASSRSGGGFGGYFDAAAGRDILINGQSDGQPSTLELNGHLGGAASFGFAGDGGELFLDAGRDLVMASSVVVQANGGRTGLGGAISLYAEEDLTIDSAIEASADGDIGEGGEFEIHPGYGTLRIGPNASIDLHGGEDGGSFAAEWSGPVVVEGLVSTSGDGTDPGEIIIVANDDISVSGTLRATATPVLYQPAPAIDLQGCDVSFVAGGLASVESNGWGARITSRESLLVDATSSLLAPGAVSFIDLIHRDPMQPPVLLGTVSPAPNVTVEETLTPCP